MVKKFVIYSLLAFFVMMAFTLGAPLAGALTNEPESPDTAEIYYDAESGCFSCWGTDMDGHGRNYYIAPGTQTWQYAGKRKISNNNWWSSHRGLYAGGVPGGTIVNGLYRQTYTCRGNEHDARCKDYRQILFCHCYNLLLSCVRVSCTLALMTI